MLSPERFRKFDAVDAGITLEVRIAFGPRAILKSDGYRSDSCSDSAEIGAPSDVSTMGPDPIGCKPGNTGWVTCILKFSNSLVSMTFMKPMNESSRKLEDICTHRDLFTSQSLNTVLLLNNAGLLCVPHLAMYSNVKCLYLNDNGINSIENLGELVKLESLFLQVCYASLSYDGL